MGYGAVVAYLDAPPPIRAARTEDPGPAMLTTMTAARRTRLASGFLLAALAGALLAPSALAAPVAESAVPAASVAPDSVVSASLGSSLLGWVNQARAARGLRPLRADATLASLATRRAVNLTNSTTFSHAAAGDDVGPYLAAVHYQWYGWAEDIAWSNATYGLTAARSIYSAWRNSPAHWAALMSTHLNYVGIGLAYRSSDHRTFASAVFSESRDHSRPSARVTSTLRRGTRITFTWTGYDAPLQTHWRGLRDFDVQYRVDRGSWRLIRDNTTSRSLTLWGRARGHTYTIRVRSRDWAGNLSGWSSVRSIYVP